ncbi:MAG: hypothetical protein DRO39_08760 [Thermoprotei archaeon]|nr:MAG: hypothetical protein DRO39_08760 [Thermoprotei archaeon]
MGLNIVFVVIDTLRADHLGCYGYFRDTSPTIDRIAREGVFFENFYASGIPTGPAFTSMITGLYPVNHRYYITPWDVPNTYQVDDDIPVLAELLLDAGYTTAAVDNLINFRSHPKHFFRGYVYYINPTRSSRWIHHHVVASDVNRHVIPWIRRHSYEKFFLFIHYWDPHMPYNQPDAYRKVFHFKDLKVVKTPTGYDYVPGWGRAGEIPRGDENKSIDLYDGEILYVNHAVAEVVETLKDEGVLDETLLVITSDHGEQLGQHGIWGHAGLHEAVIRVPLIMRCPKVLPRGARVKHYAQHVDILPTILGLAGVETEATFAGDNLLKLIRGEPIRDFIVCETWGERCVLKNGWKLIVHYEPELKMLRDEHHYGGLFRDWLSFLKRYGDVGVELYNIEQDPAETINLAGGHPDIVKELKDLLDTWVRSRLGGAQDPILTIERYTHPQPREYQAL